jgi:hypothetical protein
MFLVTLHHGVTLICPRDAAVVPRHNLARLSVAADHFKVVFISSGKSE